ncbi:MAG: hypothetical protein IPI67_22540 [Myxococcales bacterium]|nr:hypothetical protein [Myxococcales bacterium]
MFARRRAARATWFAASFALGVQFHAPAQAEPLSPSGPAKEALIADLGQHVVGVGLQHSFAPFFSAQLTASYYQPWTQNINFLGLSGEENTGGDLRGVISRGRVFFYPLASAPTGPWLSPFGQAGVGWGLRNGERSRGSVWAVGASAGYTGLVSETVLVGGGFGAQYHTAHIPGSSGPPSFARFYPQVEIQLGYVFGD